MTIKIPKRETINIARGASISIERRKPDLAIAQLPQLDMFEDEGDPLGDVEYDDNSLERSADNEMNEIMRQIIERRRSDREVFRVTCDLDYWVALCFQSRDQRNEFLEKTGWAEPNTRYLNGLEIARRLGVQIVPIVLRPLPARGKPKKYIGKEVI